jgi:hypothetical protein
MLERFVCLHTWCLAVLTTDAGSPTDGPAHGGSATASTDRGQATTEYALVMLGAAAVALLVITWATAGGGAGRIGRLFDRVIDAVASRI